MIKSFAHRGLEKFFLAGNAAGVQAIHAKKLRLILAQLDKAMTIGDMDIPTLHLHELKGVEKRHLVWDSSSKLARYFPLDGR